jgi:hypothetical protein
MTQTQIEQTRVIAERDGWVVSGEPDFNPPYKCFSKEMNGFTKVIPYISSLGIEYDGWHKDMKYLTSLDWLHPVAMNVMDVIRESRKEHYQYYVSLILNACCERPINGKYIDLFNAVYEGIVYLNSTETMINYEAEVKRVYPDAATFSFGPATDRDGNIVSAKKYSYTLDAIEFFSDTPTDPDGEPEPIIWCNTEATAWQSAYETLKKQGKI